MAAEADFNSPATALNAPATPQVGISTETYTGEEIVVTADFDGVHGGGFGGFESAYGVQYQLERDGVVVASDYTGDIKAANDLELSIDVPADGAVPGTYTLDVRVEYAGAKYGFDSLEVGTVEPADLANATVEVADQQWTGAALKPDVTVMLGTVDITSQCAVSYADNTAVGKATVTVVPAQGNTNLEGEATGAFQITSEAATDADYFSAGEVVKVTDKDGYDIAAVDGAYPLAKGERLGSVTVQPATLDVDPVACESIQYAKAQSGKEADELAYSDVAPDEAGEWWAKVSGEGAYAGGAVYVKLAVSAEALGDIFAYEVKDDDKVDDTAFSFIPASGAEAAEIELGIASDDKAVPAADIAGIKVYRGEDEVGSSANGNTVSFLSVPGDYKVKVSFAKSSAYGAVSEWLDVTVGKLDLADVDLSIADRTYTGSDIAWTLACPVENLDGFYSAKLVSDEPGATVVEKGTYEVKVSVKDGNSNIVKTQGDDGANPTTYYAYGDLVEGEQTVSFDVVGETVPAKNFYYGTQVFDKAIDTDPANGVNTEFVNEEGADPFTPSMIRVVKEAQSGTALAKYFSDDEVEITVERQNADGTWSEASSYTAAGDYRVTVKVLGSATDYEYAGSQTGYFHVTNGNLDYSDVFVAYDGKAVTDGRIDAVYTGDDVLADVEVVVRHGDKTLAEGTDYSVEVKDADGKAVESVVDAGRYTLTVSSDSYDGVEANVAIRVAKATIKAVRPVAPDYLEQGQAAYTGSEIVPAFGYTTEEAPHDEETEWKALDSALYKLSGIEYTAPDAKKAVSVDAILEVGKYTFDLALYGDVKNFDSFTGEDVALEVVDRVEFADVPADAWYADEVVKAAELKYIEGIGQKLFVPEANMTREQFAQVLANMAGETFDGSSYPTPFEDVLATSWSAGPILWATSAGIVNGTSETTFAPFESITREQIAVMLWRYAGNGAEADLSVLDEFVDGGQVSEWAQNAMAWAVEEGYMNGRGNDDLQPQGTATRAEVAALAVRVQPDGVPTV